jgi:hypothetical protein
MSADVGLAQKKQRSGKKRAGWVARNSGSGRKTPGFKR